MSTFLSILIILGLLVFLGLQVKNLVLTIKERKNKKNQNKDKEDIEWQVLN